MTKAVRLLMVVAMLATIPLLAASQSAGASSDAPRWVRHVKNYPGGISGTVRKSLNRRVVAAQSAFRNRQTQSAAVDGLTPQNVQMNDDSRPPLPQNETAVDYNMRNPLIAVAASNDYVSGGLAIMRTANGGRTWQTTRITPQFVPTRDFCNGGDPAVSYSLRDDAFYASQLCFFRSQAFSELHLFKSVDNGKTWTPARQASVAATNTKVDPDTGEITVNEAVFYDKEYITIDNHPSSPYFGRIYMTSVKFHIRPNGFSDYCPVQLSYTDRVPTSNPALTTWQHTKVVRDNPGDNGRGPSANQWAYPQIAKNGDVDIAYATEDCNSGLDRHLFLKKSTNGGTSFEPRVQIDHPGEFEDNPDLGDLLPNKDFRAPLSPSLDINKKTGALAYVYMNHLDRATSGANISVQFSFDEGQTWTHMKYLSVTRAGAPAPNDQFFPWIDSDEAGRYHAIWFDNRRDPGNKLIDTFQDDFTNSGAPYVNYRISSRSWNPDEAFFSLGNFIGDYNGIAASNEVIYPVWTDGRNSNFDNNGIGESDIFTNLERR